MKPAISVILLLSVLPGCAILFPEDPDLVFVKPVKFVPCTNTSSTCGRVPVSPDQADGFDVIVGYRRFRSIAHDCLTKDICKEDEVVRLLGAFAEKEVISRGFCKSAEVPSNRRRVLGWEGSGNRGVYVTCVD